MVSIRGHRQTITPKKRAEVPFVKRRLFLNSVVIRSIDREQVQEAVISYVNRLRREHPEIERVIWFGSWVTGLPAPGSDVDLCLILTASSKSSRDRISEYLRLGFPVGVDLFVYTREEFERLKQSSPAWHKVITSGIDIQSK